MHCVYYCKSSFSTLFMILTDFEWHLRLFIENLLDYKKEYLLHLILLLLINSICKNSNNMDWKFIFIFYFNQTFTIFSTNLQFFGNFILNFISNFGFIFKLFIYLNLYQDELFEFNQLHLKNLFEMFCL